MIHDFYAKYYGDISGKEASTWKRYFLLKCTEEGDTQHYKNSIMKYYKNKQIDPFWNYTNWFLPSEPPQVPHSILIRIESFKLRKPYISKDDEAFWPGDNPLCKDKLTKIPFVRPSSWKGSFRHVARDILKIPISRVVKLFGNEKETSKGRRGRLVFYPTFFTDIGLEVIAPHDRKTKTGKKGISPIHYEAAPTNATGTFCLLYFPFDLLSSHKQHGKIAEDLKVLRVLIPTVLTKYGFGAKTTAGYGVIKKQVGFIISPHMDRKMIDKQFGEEDFPFDKKMEEIIDSYGENDV